MDTISDIATVSTDMEEIEFEQMMTYFFEALQVLP